MIEKMDKQSFDAVYTILEQSFPEDERRPYVEQKRLLDNPAYSIYVESEEKGFIAAWEFEEFTYIEHFAVTKDSRNTGLGSRMLDEFLKMQEKTVCLEVELPDTEMAKRRIRFYERNGFFLNEYEYFQPPISKGKKIVPLMIMTSGKQISEVDFENIKDVLYREVYKYNM